ncbi:MAG: hypothetical protein IKT35_03955 [Clostridia bacterium]|nr:hypothetical protein [Clostridia bacterium]
MEFCLPKINNSPVELNHFSSSLLAFIFRAYEYIPTQKIAKVLKTTEDNIRAVAEEMGLPNYNPKTLWLEKGYITIIRRLWHILPYSQLLEVLEMDEQSFAFLLKEEDFLNIKLGDKPDCAEVLWHNLTEEEHLCAKKIKDVMKDINLSGKKPFEFEYQVPNIKFGGKELFETRMIYAFSGLYQTAFDVDSRIFCPDEQLEAYKKLGINGIWTQGVLTQLAPFPFEPSLSEGYKKRLERMKDFTERLATYGIKLYLYINEPRCLPISFFEKYPHLMGHPDYGSGNACLCTSTPEVQNYLKDSIEYVCREVPRLGGFFTITRSENFTNCYSHTGHLPELPCGCPRCRERSVGEVVGEVIGCFVEGAHRVNPGIKIFAWSWGWQNVWKDIIEHLPKEVILLSQSELDVPFNIGGVTGNVLDYSMGIIGPGEQALAEWNYAKEHGLDIAAKVQINTTWEASTIPAIPIAPSIEEHIAGVQNEGVKHLLLSWTLGGYPNTNIATAAKYFYEYCSYSAENSPTYAAEKQFSKAFKEFPFYILTLYQGPQNAGPSNLLYEKPTGYKSTMTCFAYDDLEGWRSIYPVDIFENQFTKLCEKWQEGLDLLPENDEGETSVMAQGCYCIFRSCLNQIRFIRARDEGRNTDALEAAKCELEISKKMLDLMNKNAAIGYEAANHYYFSKGQLAEKIVNCHYIIDFFSKK